MSDSPASQFGSRQRPRSGPRSGTSQSPRRSSVWHPQQNPVRCRGCRSTMRPLGTSQPFFHRRRHSMMNPRSECNRRAQPDRRCTSRNRSIEQSFGGAIARSSLCGSLPRRALGRNDYKNCAPCEESPTKSKIAAYSVFFVGQMPTLKEATQSRPLGIATCNSSLQPPFRAA